MHTPQGMPAQHPLGQRPLAPLQAFERRGPASRDSEIATSSSHPNDNGGAERANHTMTPDWRWSSASSQETGMNSTVMLSSGSTNSVSAATSLTPNEVHMGRLTRPPLTFFERAGVAGDQGLPVTTSTIATRRRATSSARMISFANTAPSPLLAWAAATPPSPTHCIQFPNSSLVAGRGCTLRRPPSARLRSLTRPRSSRSNSH